MRIMALVLTAIVFGACGTPAAAPVTATKRQAETEKVVEQRDDDCPVVAGIGPRMFAVDNYFGPDCMAVRSDATLYLQNFGEYAHTFTISETEFGSKPYLIDIRLPGGDTKPRSIELAGVLEAGSYEFFCNLHGSMDGVLEVIDPIS